MTLLSLDVVMATATLKMARVPVVLQLFEHLVEQRWVLLLG